MKRLFTRALRIFILVYCGAGIALYYLQDKILFHPQKLAAGDTIKTNLPYREYLLPVNETDSISVVQFYSKSATKRGAVIYFHGNRENVNRYAHHAGPFTEKGYDVWMMDYAGFGKSTGSLSEQKLYNDAKQVYKLVHAQVNADSIVLYGKSLGSGVAAYVAANYPCRRLILETPYYSMEKLANHYFFMYPLSSMLHYKIPTARYLEDVKAPVTLFHGTNDGVIPYQHALLLQQEKKSGTELITIQNGEHNNLSTFRYFREKLDSLLQL